LVVDEVRKTHERRASVLGEIAADSAWVSTCACIQHEAELVVVYFLSVSSDVPQVLFHVDGQFELSLDDLNQSVLRDCPLLGRVPS
jgi:hypothetical protein